MFVDFDKDFDSIAIVLVIPCPACGGLHKRPVGVKCQMQGVENNDTIVDAGLDSPDDTNTQILNALSAVSSKLTAIEQRIGKTELQLQNTTKS